MTKKMNIIFVKMIKICNKLNKNKKITVNNKALII